MIKCFSLKCLAEYIFLGDVLSSLYTILIYVLVMVPVVVLSLYLIKIILNKLFKIRWCSLCKKSDGYEEESNVMRKIDFFLSMKGNKSLIVFIFVFPCLMAFFICLSACLLNAHSAYEIGGALSGLTAPFCAAVSAFLTFIAFYVQYTANEKMKKQESIRQINDLRTEHMSVLDSVHLYEQENMKKKIKGHIDSQTVTEMVNVLRTGSEALYTLYSKMFLYRTLFLCLERIYEKRPDERWGVNTSFGFYISDSVEIDRFAELLCNNRDGVELEDKSLHELGEKELCAIMQMSFKWFVEYYGYLFMQLLNHAFIVVEQIDNNEELSESEKIAKARSFIDMLPGFELVLVFLYLEFSSEYILSSEKKKIYLALIKKYSFFVNLQNVNFFSKRVFEKNKSKYL